MNKHEYSEKLKAWMTDTGTSCKALAVLLDAPGPRVSSWRTGRRLPGHERMLAIQALSQGAVSYYCQHCKGAHHG